MANLNYYLGPLVWHAAVLEGDNVDPMQGWRAPAGVVGMVDLGSLPQCSQSTGDSRPMAFLCVDGTLGSGWDLLGSGDCREILTTTQMRQTWRGVTGYQPQGDRLVNLLSDHLMNGADPLGLDACPPLVPTADLSLEIHLGGHSRVWNEKFEWGRHKHTNKLKALLKADAKAIKDTIKDQKDLEHYQKVLGAWEIKYGAGVAKEIDPDTPSKHPSTTYTETFPVTQGVTWNGSGQDLPWATFGTVTGGYVSGGVLRQSQSTLKSGAWRMTTALSVSDMIVTNLTAGYVEGVGGAAGQFCAGRVSGSAITGYYSNISTWNNQSNFSLGKWINGTSTGIGTNGTGVKPIASDRHKITCNGSSITRSKYFAATGTWTDQNTATDTSITSNVYAATGISSGNYQYEYFPIDTVVIEDIINGPAIPVLIQQYRRRW